MPNHITHERAGLLFTPFIATSALYAGLDINHTTVLLTTYIAANYFLTPDLDTDSKPYYRWGLLRFLWFPYKQLIPHRSIWSHSGPISGTIRFLYFAIIAAVVLYFVGFTTAQLLHLVSYYAIIWLAIILVDTLHTILDIV